MNGLWTNSFESGSSAYSLRIFDELFVTALGFRVLICNMVKNILPRGGGRGGTTVRARRGPRRVVVLGTAERSRTLLLLLST